MLSNLVCSRNGLTALDVTGLDRLVLLDCSENRLSALDLTGCFGLTYLDCNRNELTVLRLDDCTSVFQHNCSDNSLTRLTLPEDARRLFQLRCTGNPLCMEIPKAFDRLRIFQHDARYEYRTEPDPTTGEIRTVATDTGRGWWYAGEPEKGRHKR